MNHEAEQRLTRFFQGLYQWTQIPKHSDFESCWLFLIFESRILLPGSYTFRYKLPGNEYF